MQKNFHGEELSTSVPMGSQEHSATSNDHNWMHNILGDIFGFSSQYDFTDYFPHKFKDGVNGEGDRHYRNTTDTETLLYLGCTTFTRLSFIVELFTWNA